MRIRRRIVIRSQTDEFLLIRKVTRFSDCWCEKCSGYASMLRPEEAALVSRLSRRLIYHLVESEAVHFVEMDDGELLICQTSLSAYNNTRASR